MHPKSDAQLLREYAETGQQAAFREIVDRYTDLAYATAMRLVESPDLAADVVQNVFLDLLRKADPLCRRLQPQATLAGWIHRSTRFAALNQRRESSRRLHRERQAMYQQQPDNPEAVDWEQLRPALDESLNCLNDSDREALLLRYFQNADLRTVGGALGISEDAAQKRVSRALDRLRDLLLRRRVMIGTSGLVWALHNHAMPAAPSGLAASLATQVLAQAGTVGTAASGLAVAATFLKKASVAVAVGVSLAAPVQTEFQASRLLQQQEASIRQQAQWLAQLREDNLQLAAELARQRNARTGPGELGRDVLRWRGRVSQLRYQVRELAAQAESAHDPRNASLQATAAFWSERAALLKDWLQTHESARIPELALLSDEEWINSIYPLALENEAEIRRALGTLRANAELHVLGQLHTALTRYAAAHGGEFPRDLPALTPHLDSPVDPAMLSRYQIVRAETLPGPLRAGGDWVITQKAPVDPEWDIRQTIGLNGSSMADCTVTNRWGNPP